MYPWKENLKIESNVSVVILLKKKLFLCIHIITQHEINYTDCVLLFYYYWVSHRL